MKRGLYGLLAALLALVACGGLVAMAIGGAEGRWLGLATLLFSGPLALAGAHAALTGRRPVYRVQHRDGALIFIPPSRARMVANGLLGLSMCIALACASYAAIRFGVDGRRGRLLQFIGPPGVVIAALFGVQCLLWAWRGAPTIRTMTAASARPARRA